MIRAIINTIAGKELTTHEIILTVIGSILFMIITIIGGNL